MSSTKGSTIEIPFQLPKQQNSSQMKPSITTMQTVHESIDCTLDSLPVEPYPPLQRGQKLHTASKSSIHDLQHHTRTVLPFTRHDYSRHRFSFNKQKSLGRLFMKTLPSKSPFLDAAQNITKPINQPQCILE